jgi:hypothetical protein
LGQLYQASKKGKMAKLDCGVLKKNGKLRVCVDYQKLNAATITDAFSLPFTDGVLDTVAAHEMYSFLDGFSRYN